MHASENDFMFMAECIERDVKTILVEEDNMFIHQALDALYLLIYQNQNNPAQDYSFSLQFMSTLASTKN